jgi:hypothetical protein
MRYIIATIIFAGGLTLGSSALAQDSDTLTCKDLVMAITGVPDSVPLSFTVPLDNFIKQCSATDGATIALVTPTTSVTVSPEHGSNQTIVFTVRDNKGDTATANLIITRD